MPLSRDIEAVMHAKETSRKDREWTNHHIVLADGAPAVGWVAVVRPSLQNIVVLADHICLQSPKPGPYIKDIKESIEYYGNRIIKDFKDKYVRLQTANDEIVHEHETKGAQTRRLGEIMVLSPRRVEKIRHGPSHDRSQLEFDGMPHVYSRNPAHAHMILG